MPFPLFIAAFIGGVMLIVTYTSIGLGLSSVSRGKFFPGIGLVAISLIGVGYYVGNKR